MRARIPLAFVLFACIVVPCRAQSLAEIAREREQAKQRDIRQEELLNLEQEMARALQWSTGAFFRRVYGDDFVGILPTGQVKDKAGWIAQIENPEIKYNSFVATDVRVRVYEETAVVTCLWSARGAKSGHAFSRQSRVTHVYVYGQRGWQMVASQETVLPG